MTEETFRDRVYREAKAAGYDADIARLIADSCKDGNDANARLAQIAALYDAKHLTADFLRHQVPFAEAWKVLEDAARGARYINAAGTFRARSAIQTRQFR